MLMLWMLQWIKKSSIDYGASDEHRTYDNTAIQAPYVMPMG
jgi:hypothetical protein